MPVSPSSSTVARLLATCPTDGEDFVHRRRVADDVLEAIPIAHLGPKLGVFLQKLFLLPHDHAVDLNRLGQERRDDLQE